MKKLYFWLHPYLKPWGAHHGIITAGFISLFYFIHAPLGLYAACFAVGWYISREETAWEGSRRMEWFDWLTPLIVAVLFYIWKG
jgi:hypothetical protein